MRIVIAGDWHSDIHEEPCARALSLLGNDVIRFPWFQYFISSSCNSALKAAKQLDVIERRWENKYLIGPHVSKMNRDLIACVADTQPEAVFVYRGTHVRPSTLKRIRQLSPRSVLVGYNNDDPFSDHYRGGLFSYWRHFTESIPWYDRVYAYRPRNINDLRAAGAAATGLLMPWFDRSRHLPVPLSRAEQERYGCDVAFVGHYEQDDRVEILRSIAQQGLSVKIWGPSRGWADALAGVCELAEALPVEPVRGPDYTKALCGAKLALAVYSKLNRDTYSRRSFEIPATGTAMLTRRTPELESIFVDGRDAFMFEGADEAAKVAATVIADDDLLAGVASAGRATVLAGGHDAEGRMEQLVKDLALILKQRD